MVHMRHKWYVLNSGWLLGSLLLLVLLVSCAVPDAVERPAVNSNESLSNQDDEPLFYFIYRDSGGNDRIASISAAGFLMPLSVDEISTSAPVLSGFNYSSINSEARIPSLYMPLLTSMSSLKQQLPAVYDGISEVEIVNKSRNAYELLLFTRFTSLPIVSAVPISIDNLETALAVATHPTLADAYSEESYISIRGIVPVIRYGKL